MYYSASIIIAMIIFIIIIIIWYYNSIDNMTGQTPIYSHAKIDMLPIYSMKNVTKDKLVPYELMPFHKSNLMYMDIMNWLGDYYLSNTPINHDCDEPEYCKKRAQLDLCLDAPQKMLYECPSSCGTCGMSEVQKDAIRNVLLYKNNFDENSI